MPKREQKIGTRSETGMNIHERMLPSQLTWSTVMSNSVAAVTKDGLRYKGWCWRDTFSGDWTEPSPWHASDEAENNLGCSEKRCEKKGAGRTKPRRPANLRLYSLYFTWGGGGRGGSEMEDLSSDAEGSLWGPALGMVEDEKIDGR